MIFSLISFTIGRLGVPIFLFLSGALLLKKQIDTDEDVLKFYKKNLLPLIIVNIVWVIIYNIFFLFTNQKGYVTVKNVIKELLIIKKVPVPNMWYFPMIIGIYIGIPFIAKIVKTFSFKSLSIATIVTFISFFVLPTINVVFNMNVTTLLDLHFLGGTYGLYIILGYFITNKFKFKTKSIYILLIAITNFILTLITQLISFSNISKSKYWVWYDNVFLLITTICLFILFCRIDDSKIKFKKAFNFVSKISLSLFFIHYSIIYILNDYFVKMQIMMPFKVIILFILGTTASIGITFVLSKIKFIAKHVLLIKN